MMEVAATSDDSLNKDVIVAAPQEFQNYGAVIGSTIDICGLFKRDPQGLDCKILAFSKD